MKEFWNERYSEPEYAYGTAPNVFLRDTLSKLTPGRILFPAEGEGRNAVYAAQQGWQIEAFDLSEAGQQKAEALAKENQVEINYTVADFNKVQLPKNAFDAVALIFAHFPAEFRADWHMKLIASLKPRGYLIMEAFSKDQVAFNSKHPSAGGPKQLNMLYDAPTLRNDFKQLKEHLLEIKVVHLEEGIYHYGESSVIRYIGQKD